MIRTQIYITEQEKHSLQSLGITTGKSQSELIRIGRLHDCRYSAGFELDFGYRKFKTFPYD